jgi:hypothetical protein
VSTTCLLNWVSTAETLGGHMHSVCVVVSVCGVYFCKCAHIYITLHTSILHYTLIHSRHSHTTLHTHAITTPYLTCLRLQLAQMPVCSVRTIQTHALSHRALHTLHYTLMHLLHPTSRACVCSWPRCRSAVYRVRSSPWLCTHRRRMSPTTCIMVSSLGTLLTSALRSAMVVCTCSVV